VVSLVVVLSAVIVLSYEQTQNTGRLWTGVWNVFKLKSAFSKLAVFFVLVYDFRRIDFRCLYNAIVTKLVKLTSITVK